MIDLRSDTVTKPTPAMKQAMFDAPLGDDVMGEDPTVNLLEEAVATLLGKEAAMFTCSATQANQIAVNIHCRPGDELLINSQGHIGVYEGGGPAALSGVTVRPIDSEKGMLNVPDLKGMIRPDDPHYTRSRLVCLENTTNIGGGYAYQLDDLADIENWAHSEQLMVHLDGARLFNASISAGYSVRDVACLVDTVSLCFSKGLGCPMGAVLAGSSRHIHRARRVRKMLGGGLRQAGIVAAAAQYALQNNIDRLAEDHRNARRLANGLSEIPNVIIDPDAVESNLVFFEVDSETDNADGLVKKLNNQGVKMLTIGKNRIRAVTHLDISEADIDETIGIFQGLSV